MPTTFSIQESLTAFNDANQAHNPFAMIELAKLLGNALHDPDVPEVLRQHPSGGRPMGLVRALIGKVRATLDEWAQAETADLVNEIGMLVSCAAAHLHDAEYASTTREQQSHAGAAKCLVARCDAIIERLTSKRHTAQVLQGRADLAKKLGDVRETLEEVRTAGSSFTNQLANKLRATNLAKAAARRARQLARAADSNKRPSRKC